MTIIDHAAGLPGRAAGAVRGAADAARGVEHEARAWGAEKHPSDREEAARARWEAGLPARNQFERDAYDSIENGVAAGMNRLERQGKQATAMEAAMTKEAENREAGQ